MKKKWTYKGSWNPDRMFVEWSRAQKKNREEEIPAAEWSDWKTSTGIGKYWTKDISGYTFFREEADSLKHQLDMVIAEKLALEQQVENTNEEMARFKNDFEETNLKNEPTNRRIIQLKERT